MSEKIQKSAEKIAHWVEKNGYKAYDPGDGNLSFFHPLTFNHPFLERLLQQAVYRAPWNVRPIFGIKPHTSTKGMGYLAWGYTKMFARTRRKEFSEGAQTCLNWLIENKSPGRQHYCWGNHFLFSSRGGVIPKLEPTIVWSGLIGQAFLEAYEVLNIPKYREVATSVCEWIKGLPRETTPTGVCLSYTGGTQSSIHNSNLLGCALLARVGALNGDRAALELAKQSALYACSRIRPDGAWYYGEAEKYHWIDNFHTGYNLDSLKRYSQATGDRQFDAQVRRGWDYFKANFFEPSGRPKYYHNQVYPIDIQCAAQAIDTLTFFSDTDPDALPLARKVAEWTIDNMQDADGHFYYRRNGWSVNRAPMLHWGQGTMFKALAHLLAKLAEANPALAPKSKPSIAASAKPQDAPALEASQLRYALVTPARNEEKFIKGALASVTSQTVRPVKWVIVSDGSTDGTDEMVRGFAAEHPWIELLRLPEHRERQFAAKARAFNAGCERLANVEYDIVGNLDADITFEPGYIEFLLGKFAANPRLGVAGTPFTEDGDGHTYAHQFAQLEHVSGACQLFRKLCFEEVGGYVPVRAGAIDWIAVTTARMKGWQTRTFTEKVCIHNREIGVGSGSDGKLRMRFHYGRKAYMVGGHPVWECLRGLFQMRQKPFIVGGLWFVSGYVWTALRRGERAVSPELMAFHRGEQMERLRCARRKILGQRQRGGPISEPQLNKG